MFRSLMIASASSAVLALSLTAFAQQSSKYGSAEEAKNMLTKAIAVVKADKTKALDMFNKGEGGFLDRDLYPFCFNKSDGKILADSNPYSKQIIGKDVRSLTVAKGKVYGPDSTLRRRNRMVESGRSATCFRGRTTRPRFKK